MLIVSMLEAADAAPSFAPASLSARLYDSLVQWGLQMDMYTLCWMAFTSACYLSMSGALLAGLDGQYV